MPDAVEKKVDALYALPLDEFTPARNALAKELKGSEDAARVKGLKKPTRAAGAINRAARASKRDVKRLLAAAAKLGDAQRALVEGGGDRGALRKATEAERAAVERLMGAVKSELEKEGGAGEAMVERARGTLHAAATDGELREQLESGRVTEDHTAVGLGGLGDVAGDGGGKGANGGRRAASAKREPAAARKKQQTARRRLKEAEQELEAAERRLRRAEETLAEARERAEAAESAAKQAMRERDRAAKARDSAAAKVAG